MQKYWQFILDFPAYPLFCAKKHRPVPDGAQMTDKFCSDFHELIQRRTIHMLADLGIELVEIAVEAAGIHVLAHSAADEFVVQAVIDLKGAVDGLDHQADGNLRRLLLQIIASRCTLTRADDFGHGKLAQNLERKAQGNAGLLGDELGAFLAASKKAVYNTQRIVCFIGYPHDSYIFLSQDTPQIFRRGDYILLIYYIIFDLSINFLLTSAC